MSTDSAIGTVRKNGFTLGKIEEWPRRKNHWKDGRSAKENARAWLAASPNLQREIAQVLADCGDIGPLRHWCAEPEARIAIDAFPGQQPNIDLFIHGEDNRGPVVIAIEAKADEPFGNKLDRQYRVAGAALASSCRSKAVARIEALRDRFALDLRQHPVPQLRYQLLTVTAAVLDEAARRASGRAVMIVHEFVTPLTVQKNRERNANDLDCFLATAFGHKRPLPPGHVAGPLYIKGAPALYVGKARTIL